jgi:hypothetical protein
LDHLVNVGNRESAEGEAPLRRDLAGDGLDLCDHPGTVDARATGATHVLQGIQANAGKTSAPGLDSLEGTVKGSGDLVVAHSPVCEEGDAGAKNLPLGSRRLVEGGFEVMTLLFGQDDGMPRCRHDRSDHGESR